MTFLAAETAHHAPPPVVIAIGLALMLAMLLAVLLSVRCAWKDRRELRGCPRCGARAVRRARGEQIAPRLTRVALECGQCSTWRRIVVEDDVWRGETRRVERDRQRLARRVRRAEAVRGLAECREFAARLHSEIAGAEDFLARTRPPAPIDRSGY